MSDAEAGLLGCCGLCIYSALNSWCILRPFGADVRCCGGPRGCCGSCCDSFFDEDDFDERMKREQAKNGADAEPVASQPAPLQPISTATGNPEPEATNDSKEVR